MPPCTATAAARGPGIPAPLVGAERIAKAAVGWGRRAPELGLVHRQALVNGDPGLVFSGPDRRVVWVSVLEIADGVVAAIRSILNPDKLAHFPPR